LFETVFTIQHRQPRSEALSRCEEVHSSLRLKTHEQKALRYQKAYMEEAASDSPSSQSHTTKEELISKVVENLSGVEQDLYDIQQDIALINTRISEMQRLLRLLLLHDASGGDDRIPIRNQTDEIHQRDGSEWTIEEILQSSEQRTNDETPSSTESSPPTQD
jgi:hypothetical protein